MVCEDIEPQNIWFLPVVCRRTSNSFPDLGVDLCDTTLCDAVNHTDSRPNDQVWLCFCHSECVANTGTHEHEASLWCQNFIPDEQKSVGLTKSGAKILCSVIQHTFLVA